ncbi:MAG: hypothetical protein ABL894_05755 [Hyphomicrobium sp.]
MTVPRLLIRKVMLNIQGRIRPCIQVQADIPSLMVSKLSEHFITENLFKRSSYSQGWPAGVPSPSPALAPHLSNFMKNDACPEITVKTLIAGQMHQCQGVWEMMAFEYVAQRAFDNLCSMMLTVAEIGIETVYTPTGSDLAAFAADFAAEMAAVPEAISISPPEGLADAA